jgi:drug/metabolite transporter (DMT)-like permease
MKYFKKYFANLSKGIHFSVIMSTFGAFAIVQTFLTTWALGELCLPACGRDRYLMVLLAVFSFAGQILLTMALQHEQAGPVAIARSADVVFAFIWQVTISCIPFSMLYVIS